MRRFLSGLSIACVLLHGCGEREKPPVSPGTPPAPTRKTEDIAWGEPVKGLRMGLSPAKIVLAREPGTYKVTVWYENLGTKAAKVPQQEGSSLWNLMFAYEHDGRTAYIDPPGLSATMIPVHEVLLKPGERFCEEMPNRLKPGFPRLAPLKLPLPDLGKSLVLRAAYGPYVDAAGARHWNLPETLKTGAITVTRAAAAGPVPSSLRLPEPADVKEITVDPRVIVGPASISTTVAVQAGASATRPSPGRAGPRWPGSFPPGPIC
jgi:hypothetical protein